MIKNKIKEHTDILLDNKGKCMDINCAECSYYNLCEYSVIQYKNYSVNLLRKKMYNYALVVKKNKYDMSMQLFEVLL